MILNNAKLDVNTAIMLIPPDKRESCNLLSVIMHNNYIKGLFPLGEREREIECLVSYRNLMQICKQPLLTQNFLDINYACTHKIYYRSIMYFIVQAMHTLSHFLESCWTLRKINSIDINKLNLREFKERESVRDAFPLSRLALFRLFEEY